MTGLTSSDPKAVGQEVVPVVNYFVPETKLPHLLAYVCERCGARYLERRNGCGRCSCSAFNRQPVPSSGTVKTYTVVWRNAPTVATPFVSCVVDLGDGLVVKSNLVGIDPASVDPCVLGQPVELVTSDLGTGADGTLARTFAFTLANGATA